MSFESVEVQCCGDMYLIRVEENLRVLQYRQEHLPGTVIRLSAWEGFLSQLDSEASQAP
jgi:hypothetical protein